jgi:hypothetical protein
MPATALEAYTARPENRVAAPRATDRIWDNTPVTNGSDWSVFVLADGTVSGQLLEFSLNTIEDDTSTSPHLEAIAVFCFPYAVSALRALEGPLR